MAVRDHPGAQPALLHPAVEAAYPATPLQQGMLLHALLGPGTGVNLVQTVAELHETIDPARFRSGWAEVMRRHAILRTAFVWEAVAEPQQQVARDVEVPLLAVDWRGRSPAEQETGFATYLETDRARGFRMDQAPLFRVALFQMGPRVFRMVFTWHHGLLDGRSCPLLLEEVFRLNHLEGRAEAQPVTRPFRDYVEWLRAGDWSRAEAFWRARLSGFSAPTPLVVDTPPVAERLEQVRRGVQEMLLPGELYEALRGFAGDHELTLNTLVQGAWALLLGRYSGEPEVVFGATRRCRNAELEGLEDMIGPTINTLPLRVPISDDQTLLEWLRGLRQQWLELREHEHAPLALVQGWSQVPTGTALFESIVVFENRLTQDVLSSYAALRTTCHLTQTSYALTLAADAGECLAIRLEYDSARFDAPVVRRMLGHLERLLAAMATGTGRTLGELSLLTEPERCVLLDEWNVTNTGYNLEQTLADLLEAQAERSPEAEALRFGERSLSYGELDLRANQLAEQLATFGVRPGVLVGVCAERSIELVTALVAVIKSGGAYVPLDPDYPADRLAFMLEDSAPPVLLTQTPLLGRLPAFSGRVVCLDAERTPVEAATRVPLVRAGPGDPAYMIYTSGSTGRPKGALNAHRGIVNRLLWMQERFQLGSGDTVLQKTPFSFDVSVWEFFWPLMTGARLVLARPGAQGDARYLSALIQRERVTVLHFVPSMLRAFLAEPESAGCGSLRDVICSGEALPYDLTAIFFSRLHAALHNLYGPTEAAVDVTCWTCDPAAEGPSVPIGRPIANTRTYILDPRGEPTPVGVPGELYLGGVQVGMGYWKRPELTAQRFVADRFARKSGARLYRTGDLARWREDGNIEFLGRLDFQVKLHGFRVELGEIEAVLAAQPGVRGAVALVREDVPGEQQLVAYVVAEPGAAIDSATLRRALQRLLPDFMVPALLIQLDELPLSPSGKLDRRALPAPGRGTAPGREFIAPRTEAEKTLAAIWRSLLKLERVSVTDNFFELGGNSILGMLVSVRARAAGLPLNPKDVLQRPTIEACAAVSRPDGGATIPRRRARGPTPLSYGQELLWLMDRLSPGVTAWNVPWAYRLRGPLDLSALQRALNLVVERHETLRTVFCGSDESVRQEVRPAGPVYIERTDLSMLAPAAREAALLARVREEARTPFDLAGDPLLRVRLIQLASADQVLCLTSHHIVTDGWSRGILLREISLAYAAARSGASLTLPTLPVQFSDYAAWERNDAHEASLAESLAYWRRQLGGRLPALVLPADRPPGNLSEFDGDRRVLVLPRDLVAALAARARQLDMTLYMVLLAGYVALLHRYTGQEDVIIGSPIAGRSQDGTEGLIGYFANMLALRNRVTADMSFAELLGQVRQTCLDAYGHQEVPFEKLVLELQGGQSPTPTPPFQAVLTMEDTIAGALELDGVHSESLDTGPSQTKFDLTLLVAEQPEGLRLSLWYRTDRFEPQTVDRLLGHFQALLRSAAENPAVQVSRLALLSERDATELERTDATARDLGPATTMTALIEATVDRFPGRSAVICDDQSLSYAELERRSNQLAHQLRGCQVGAGTPVGLGMDRSIDALVGVLGILKAGGCYVPLVPLLPTTRLARQMADAGVTLIVTLAEHLDRWPENARPICLDRDAGTLATAPTARPEPLAGPDDLAYVLFTSGSTGTPKGVAVSHANLVHYIRAISRVLADTPLHAGGDGLAALSGWSFGLGSTIAADLGNTALFPALAGGGTVVILPTVVVTEPARYADYLDKHPLDVLKLTPGHLRALIGERTGPNLAAVLPRRWLVLGGETLHWDQAERLLGAGKCRVLNHYGPTETTVGATAYRVGSRHEAQGSATVPIGLPLANVQVHVLDPNRQRVPIGVPGELYIGGAGVAQGYLHRPELSAERFVEVEGLGRLYCTGDQVRRLPQGELEFLGRLDGQVKVRGQRVELGEVEKVVGRFPGVTQCVVGLREVAGLPEPVLVAYVVAHSTGYAAAHGERPTPDRLREWAAIVLPEFMVPRNVVLLERIPLTRNGKVDYGALPVPDGQVEEASRVAARSKTESALAQIWAEALRRDVDAISMQDDFLRLGGHSLTAIRILGKISKAFGVRLPLRSLFDAPTIERLGVLVDAEVRKAENSSERPAPGISRRSEAIGGQNSETALPTSFAQQRFWLLDQINPGAVAYLIPSVRRLSGKLDARALAAALNAIVARHEALRTVFVLQNELLAQLVRPSLVIELPILDLSALGPAARDEALQAALLADARQPFDLAQGPLLRATLYRLEAEEHVLSLTLHHIVSDGWSVGILESELSTGYAAALHDKPLELAPLPLQYADFAIWQRREAEAGAIKRQLGWWSEQLRAPLPELALPTDRPRQGVVSSEGGREELLIPGELVERVRAVARAQDATAYVAFLAAFHVLLSRWTGQHDVIVGSVSSGRHRAEIQPLIGLFVNTLAIRGDLGSAPSFTTFVSQIRDRVLGGLANQDVPFEMVVDTVQPDWDRSRSAVFQAAFHLREGLGGTAALEGISTSLMPAPKTAVKFELTLNLLSAPDGGFQIVTLYATDLFDPETIRRLNLRYRTLLESIAVSPELPVTELALLSEGERAALAEWNSTGTAEAPAQTVVELFEGQAARVPGQIAVIGTSVAAAEAGKPVSITYAELNARANQLAHRLRARGVGPNDRVGLALDRSVDTIVALLGILKAGGCYVPVPPQLPAARIADQLAQSTAKIVVSAREHREKLPPEIECIALDSEASALGLLPSSNPVATAAPGDLAYVLFTSGSTGKPKGVAVTHENIVQYSRAVARVLGEVPRERSEVFELFDRFQCGITATIGFDAGNTSLYPALFGGGTVHFLANEAIADPARFAAYVEEFPLDLLKITPGHLRLLLGEKQDAALRAVLPRHTLVVGGEALPLDLAHKLIEAGSCRLLNHYGPTETTVGVLTFELTAATLSGALARGAQTVPVGVPLANTRVYVVDAYGNEQPVGVPGELLIGGALVAPGYLDRPDLTAERFVSFRDDRVYRTGDRVRRLCDGQIEFLGRLDDQIKIRGYRVELGEIEALLSGQPGVARVAAIVREDLPGDQRLVAYVQWKAEHAGEVVALREALSRALPAYMVPAHIVAVDRFPLTSNGKVDRKALPAPDPEFGGRVSDPPVTTLEAVIATEMADLLGIVTVGRREDFFQLGGHSLLAMRLLGRLRQNVAPALTLQAVFEHATVAGLAQVIESAHHAGRPALVIPRRTGVSESPLSFAQELIWVQSRMDREAAAYNVPALRRLRGPFDRRAWQQALDEMVIRHAALRSVVRLAESGPVQQVRPPRAVGVELIDCSSASDPLATAVELARTAAARRFDLSEDLLLRSGVYPLGADDHVVLLVTHHIASDAQSSAILWTELVTAYEAARQGMVAVLPPLALEYGDYAAWQRERLQGAALEELVGYWTEALAGTPALLDLPTDRPRGRSTVGPGAILRCTLHPGLLAELNGLAASQGATLYMTLLAAWQVLLHRYSGQTDFVVGSPVGGRPTAFSEAIVGDFVNTVLLRARFEDDPSFAECIARVKTTAIGALGHDELPLEQLALSLRERTGAAPQYQVVFAFQDTPASSARFAALGTERLSAHLGAAKFELSLGAAVAPDGLHLQLSYRSDLFDHATVERLLGHYRALLEAIPQAPHTRVAALPIMGADERRRLLEEWNDTRVAYPRDSTIPELFAEQVLRAPHAIAAVWEQGSLSYQELAQRAAALAARLHARGVRPGARIGLCVERSPELLVGMLGILQTGAAYVPLEPGYPAERLAYMLLDTGLSAVVMQDSLRGALLESMTAVSRLEGVDPAQRAAWQPPALVLVSGHAPAEAPPEESETGPTGPLDPAYVMYTSGSTGRPKGVIVPHRAVIRLVRGADYVELGPGEVILGFAPGSFDASTFEIWGALLNGGRLVLVPPGLPALSELGSLIERHGITTLWLTAALFQEVVDGGLEQLRGVRQLLAGGDVLSPSHVRQVLAELPDCRLINGYGPTENTTFTCCYPIPRGWAGEHPVPIGRPIANTRVYVLDRGGQPVPVGVAGELYAAGDGVALGYLNQPALSGRQFRKDPFDRVPGARMYATGDRVRWRADGVLEFLGRMDAQVKVRGFRVEPGEIEAALLAVPEVRAASVVAQGDPLTGRKLAGYYVVRPGERLGSAALRARLKGKLPDYMIPAELVELDELPLGPTGKVDRGALPLPDAYRIETRQPPAAPHTIIQHELVHLWESLLAMRPVGIRDDFFELGGNSLLAMRMLAEVERLRGRRLPFGALFHHATIEQLAEALVSAVHADQAPGVVVLQEGGAGTPFVFAHGEVNGDGWYCRRLAPLLGEAPLILLPTLRPGGPDDPASIPAIARVHVAQLRKVQPHGPYRLGGYCHGGQVAYEMARILASEGDAVERLVVVDTTVPFARLKPLAPLIKAWSHAPTESARVTRRAKLQYALWYYQWRLRQLPRMGSRELGRWLLRRLRHPLGGGAPARQPVAGTPQAGSDETAPEMSAVGEFIVRAQRAYLPGPYAGRLDLIWATAKVFGLGENFRGGWEWVVKDLHMQTVEGTHVSIVANQNLPALAERIRACLDR